MLNSSSALPPSGAMLGLNYWLGVDQTTIDDAIDIPADAMVGHSSISSKKHTHILWTSQ
jgi:hypothetical protein